LAAWDARDADQAARAAALAAQITKLRELLMGERK
jgi:hypothetical protein